MQPKAGTSHIKGHLRPGSPDAPLRAGRVWARCPGVDGLHILDVPIVEHPDRGVGEFLAFVVNRNLDERGAFRFLDRGGPADLRRDGRWT